MLKRRSITVIVLLLIMSLLTVMVLAQDEDETASPLMDDFEAKNCSPGWMRSTMPSGTPHGAMLPATYS
ncbi:MAG: hypothetical protein ACFE0Q_00950 [Anaerolineae bacterium]